MKREESIKVFVRVRPPIYKEVKLENAVFVKGNQGISVSTENKELSCNYDYVFGELSEQQQIFEKVQPVLVDVLSGVNACIFCYGQTSSGKSFTMIGPEGGQDVLSIERKDWGILPRAAEFLLNYLNDKSEEGLLTFEAKASFLQVYNENLYDLLRDSGPKIEDHLIINERDKDHELKIREVPKPKSLAMTARDHNSPQEIYVSGLSEFRVQTSDDIMRILAIGTNNRMTRSTDFNLTSSRSHAILQLTFEIETQVESGQTLMCRSKLYLVDLAGSEKIPYASSDNPKHIKELTSINKSLSSLGNVISALATSNRSHIPYRESKLTRILQDSLGGNTRTILIACIAPTVVHSSETLSTLQFADRAKNVKVTVKANTVVDDKVTLAKAQAEITRLKALLGHALKQLEEKSNGLGNTALLNMDMLQLSEENEKLKRENQSLKKLLKTSSTPLKSFDRPERRERGERGRSVSPTSESSSISRRRKVTDNAADGETKKDKRKPAPFMSGVDRFGRPIFDNVGNYLKAAGKMKKMNLIKEQQSDYDSDKSDGDSHRKGKYSGPQSANRLRPLKKKGKEDLNQNNNPAKNQNSALYKAINERQVAELNILLEEANRKMHEQYLANMNKNAGGNATLIDKENEKTTSSNPETKSSHSSMGELHKPEEMSETIAPANHQGKDTHNLSRQQNHHHPGAQQPPAFNNDPHQQPPHSMTKPNSPNSTNPSARLPYPAPPNLQQNMNEPDVMMIARQHTNALTQEIDQQPNNRIFIRKGGNNNNNGPRANPNLPPVIDANSSAGHSANLFASAVNMYSNINRLANHGNRNPNQQPPPQQYPQQHLQPPGYPSSYPHNNNNNNNHQMQPNPSNYFPPGYNDDPYRQSNPPPQGRADYPLQHMPPPRPQQQPHQYPPQQQQQQYQQPPPSSHNNNNVQPNSRGSMRDRNMPIVLPHQYANPVPNQATNLGPGQSSASNNSNKSSANLTFTMDDVGRAVELFSFRLNTWERIDLIDFEQSKRQYKVQFPDGSIQWLDLTKKPTRSLHDEVSYRH